MLETKIPPLTKKELNEIKKRERDIAIALDEFYASETMPLDVAGMRHNDIPHHVLVNFMTKYHLGYPSDMEEFRQYRVILRNRFSKYF